MQHKQKNKPSCFTCPLTQNKIPYCNVTTCMWFSSGHRNNCSITDKTMSEYELGEKKGYSINAVNKHIRKGKSEIIKILTLDKYINWIKENPVNLRLRGKKYIKEIFKQTLCCNKIFFIDYRIFAAMCLEETYKKFKEENPELKKNKLGFLLGVRENKLRTIQKLTKVKK